MLNCLFIIEFIYYYRFILHNNKFGNMIVFNDQFLLPQYIYYVDVKFYSSDPKKN